jgi:hypothetical protein
MNFINLDLLQNVDWIDFMKPSATLKKRPFFAFCGDFLQKPDKCEST